MVKRGKAKAQVTGALKDEEVIAQITGGAKNGKTPKKVVPPKHVEEDSDEIEEDSGADVMAEPDSDDEQENAVDDEEESDDEEEEAADGESDEEEEEEDNDDDDENEITNISKVKKQKRSAPAEDSGEEPSEEPIGKKATGSTAKKGLKYGVISPTIPNNKIIFVTNIQTATKPNELAEIFDKYGDIVGMFMNARGPLAKVLIAFKTAEAAKAALAVNGEAKIRGSVIHVTPKSGIVDQFKTTREADKGRTIMVTSLKKGTTEEQLREHFASSGTIESINPKVGKNTFAFIVFADQSQALAAKKLNYSEINGVSIHVKTLLDGDDHDEYQKKIGHTIIMNNTAKLDAFSLAKLQSIFEQCGEIEFAEIICKKKVLAFITFKNEKAATKALKLNGSTVDGLEVSVDKYVSALEKPKTTIFIQNVKPGVTEEEVRELFSKCGEIESVFMKAGFCTVRFKEQESFCKSFLLNESMLHYQMIFIEPYSEKKQTILRKMQNKTHQPPNKFNQHKPYPQGKPFQKFQGPRDQQPNRKRPMHIGKGVNPKKPRGHFAN